MTVMQHPARSCRTPFETLCLATVRVSLCKIGNSGIASLARPFASLSWAVLTTNAVTPPTHVIPGHSASECDMCLKTWEVTAIALICLSLPFFQMKSLTDLSAHVAKDKVTDHAAEAQNHNPHPPLGLTQ